MWRSISRAVGIGCGGLLVIPLIVLLSIVGIPKGPFTPKYKVEWEHGIKLPDSATVLYRENTGVPWMDSHASATVTMDPHDLPALLKQLTPARKHYRMAGTPWRRYEKDGTCVYWCDSKSSDGQMFVTVKPPRGGIVTVELGTATD